MAMPSLAFAQPKQDKLRALGIMALNGMFDEMDGVSVLRQAVTELLPGDIAIVSSFGADSSVLLHMVAHVTKLEPRELIISVGDTHLYTNHIGPAIEQLRRKPYPFPTLKIVGNPASIDDFHEENFLLENYQSHPHIKADLVIV